jgi:uncharacterized protein YbjT (DUF2867 family)
MITPIVVCGATGNVGSKVVETFLTAGEPVRAVGRERVRLGPLAAKGAETWPGDIGNEMFLEKAFAGARAAFILIPPKPDAPDIRSYQKRTVDSLVSAISKTRIPRVVTLSSIGAHLPEGTGPILGLHDLEKKLGSLRNTDVVHLRAAYFMENHLWSIPVIREYGVNGGTLRPDLPVAMVATKDIADTAARLLIEGSFTGHAARYLLGPRDLTMAEATRILGEAIGKPELEFVPFPEAEASKAMAGMGMSESVVLAFLEMYSSFNAGRIRATQERNAENTTKTTLEEFARTVFAPAYRAAA